MDMQNSNTCLTKNLSWGGVVAGALVALGLTFLFNLLTTALGLSLFTKDPDGARVLAFAGYAWVLIGGYVLLFISGWVAGRMVYDNDGSHWCNGIVLGFVTWTFYLILSLMVLSYLAAPVTANLLRTTFIGISDDNVPTATVTTPTSTTTTTPASTETVNRAGWVAFGTFFIFLVGAFGACMGAVMGMRGCSRRTDTR